MDTFEMGYRHFEHNSSVYFGTFAANNYVNKVQTELDKLICEMSQTVNQRSNSKIDQIKGFIAEDFHAGTFNVDVASKGGKNIRAVVDKSNNPIKDIDINVNGKTFSFQSKYYNKAENTAKELSNPKYNKVGKVAPSDQIANDGIKKVASKQALRNKKIRPNVSDAYDNTAKNVKDTIEKNGYASKGLSESDAKQIVEDIKNGTFDPKKYGLVTEKFVKIEYVLKEAFKAGINAAIISSILKVTPEIYKLILELINDGTISKEEISKLGLSSLNTPVEGFFRGYISAAITATFKSGLTGEVLESLDPTFISVATVLMINAIHNSINVTLGRMSKHEFVDACTRDIFISSLSFYSGYISQGLIQIPVIGFMLGSFVGSIIGALVYDTGKSICLSFCVESGFTFFGLVTQDYRLPEEIIKEIGVNVFEYEKFQYKKFEFDKFNFTPFTYEKFIPDTININFIRRGVIGVNKIGYKMQ
jgi:hypothetical protein